MSGVGGVVLAMGRFGICVVVLTVVFKFAGGVFVEVGRCSVL
jgi:hypothetical protein